MPQHRIWQVCRSLMEGFVPDEAAQERDHGLLPLWLDGEKDGGCHHLFWRRANCIAVQYRKSVKLPAPVALAVVDDDTEHAVRLDANFDETWGDKLGLRHFLEHGKKGRHIVTIRLAETHADDAVPFYLVSVIAAGRRGRD